MSTSGLPLWAGDIQDSMIHCQIAARRYLTIFNYQIFRQDVDAVYDAAKVAADSIPQVGITEANTPNGECFSEDVFATIDVNEL
jgi:hypothetical protein